MWCCSNCGLSNLGNASVCVACFQPPRTDDSKTERKEKDERLHYKVTFHDEEKNMDVVQETPTNKSRKSIRIYLDGCWDMCHSGHYNAIRQARQLGDELVVGCHSDAEIALHKRNPVMNNEERVGALEACKWVDRVEFGVPYTIREGLLEELNCDFAAHGDDVPRDKDGNSAYHLVEDRLKIFKRTPGVSTTALVSKLLSVDRGERASSSSCSSWTQFLSTSRRIAQFSNNRLPRRDDVVVYVDGVFDLFHIGHVTFLKTAREYFEQRFGRNVFLYCGIHPDEVVAKLKGNCFPLMSLQERTLCVLSCKYVDEVVIGCPLELTSDMLKAMKVDWVATAAKNNGDYDLNETAPPSRYDVAKRRGIHVDLFGEGVKLHSLNTEMILNRIRENREDFVSTNREREKKERNYLDHAQYVTES